MYWCWWQLFANRVAIWILPGILRTRWKARTTEGQMNAPLAFLVILCMSFDHHTLALRGRLHHVSVGVDFCNF